MPDRSIKGGIIYGARNRANGKWYVGQTVQKLQTRLRGHLHRSRKGSDQAFHEALRKYGIEGFDLYVLAVCKDRPEMNLAERFWIKKLKSMVHSGYNLTDGGEGSRPCDEVRRRMSDAKKGRVITEEWKQHLREARKHKVYTAETRAKMSAWQVGRKRPDITAALTGRRLSEETRKKLSEATKKTMTPERREAIAAKQRQLAATRPKKDKPPVRPNMKGENNPAYGQKWSPERKAAHSERLRGKKFTEEHKAKIAAALKGKTKPWMRRCV